jgi:small-conductance mechanosensitive channel
MSYNYLRSVIGRLFLGFHFIILVVCILFRMINWYDDLTLVIAMSILAALMAPHVPRILKLFVLHKHNFAKGKAVNKPYITTVFFVTGIFMFFISAIIVKQAVWPSSITPFTESLGAAEAIFGLSMEAIISDLFGLDGSPTPTSYSR